MFNQIRGGQALKRLISKKEVTTILDVGCGDGLQAHVMRDHGLHVTTVSMEPPADYVGDFAKWPSTAEFDAVFASHVLEHQPNVQQFLHDCRRRIRMGGYLAVTVPPAKHNIVGGHVTLWNAGLLLYNLILAGFDCSRAAVGTYGYNISVIVQRGEDIALPALKYDNGDILRLAHLFPCYVTEGFNGELPDINWSL